MRAGSTCGLLRSKGHAVLPCQYPLERLCVDFLRAASAAAGGIAFIWMFGEMQRSRVIVWRKVRRGRESVRLVVLVSEKLIVGH